MPKSSLVLFVWSLYALRIYYVKVSYRGHLCNCSTYVRLIYAKNLAKEWLIAHFLENYNSF